MTQADVEFDRERLLHDLSWHYDEVERLRTVLTRAVNILTNPRWPGDPDPHTAVLQLLSEALQPNSRVGKDYLGLR